MVLDQTGGRSLKIAEDGSRDDENPTITLVAQVWISCAQGCGCEVEDTPARTGHHRDLFLRGGKTQIFQLGLVQHAERAGGAQGRKALVECFGRVAATYHPLRGGLAWRRGWLLCFRGLALRETKRNEAAVLVAAELQLNPSLGIPIVETDLL